MRCGLRPRCSTPISTLFPISRLRRRTTATVHGPVLSSRSAINRPGNRRRASGIRPRSLHPESALDRASCHVEYWTPYSALAKRAETLAGAVPRAVRTVPTAVIVISSAYGWGTVAVRDCTTSLVAEHPENRLEGRQALLRPRSKPWRRARRGA